jgi:hypothetical protein
LLVQIAVTLRLLILALLRFAALTFVAAILGIAIV